MLEENMREWRRGIRREARQEGMRLMLLQLLEQCFGRVPLKVRRQVAGIGSAAELQKLAKRVLQARSLQEMGLG